MGKPTWNPRQRFRIRQFLEKEKDQKWEEYDVVGAFNEHPDIAAMRFRYTQEFSNVFNMGYQNYAEGEWGVAGRMLQQTQTMLGVDDGPSTALLKFMEMSSYEAPDSWN